jgi:hypothetical protein
LNSSNCQSIEANQAQNLACYNAAIKAQNINDRRTCNNQCTEGNLGLPPCAGMCTAACQSLNAPLDSWRPRQY